MRELSLFSGAGGGLLGTKLLGWEHCGYVEFNDYCQRVIRQRILDGILDDAPIFGDINAFISEGYAESYKGLVDVVTAGFPCQPFSVAGQQKGADDERNMWPQTLAVLREVQPRYAFLENVPGLFAHEYARRIFGDLAESGFNARWKVLSAAEVGAPHKRDRVWIVGYSTGKYSYECDNNGEDSTSKIPQFRDASCKKNGSDTLCKRLEGQQLQLGTTTQYSITGNSCWWESEPNMGRVANGVANRVDRLKALGNGQVSAVAASAWRSLNE